MTLKDEFKEREVNKTLTFKQFNNVYLVLANVKPSSKVTIVMG